jgi:hypothetical protein
MSRPSEIKSPVDLAGLFHARVDWWAGGDAMEKKRVGWGGFALAGMIILPLALYVGAYYANATTKGAMWYGETGDGPITCPAPRYRMCESVSKSIFAPMHAIDRRLRPGVWTLPFDPWEPQDDEDKITRALEFSRRHRSP